MRIESAPARKAMRLQQIEPAGPVERRRKAGRARCGGQPHIISVIFTVPMHSVALYHHSPNSR